MGRLSVDVWHGPQRGWLPLPPLYPYHQAHDLGMWLSFLQSYNGQSCWLLEVVLNSQLELCTDAAGFCGFDAFFYGDWSAECWPASGARMDHLCNLTRLEHFPIIVAIELWGDRLRDR